MNNIEITKLNIVHKTGDSPYFGVYNGVITEHGAFPYNSFYKGNPLADVPYVDAREAGVSVLDSRIYFRKHLNGNPPILVRDDEIQDKNKKDISDETEEKVSNQYSNLNDKDSPHYDKTGDNEDHFYKLYTDIVGSR
jgi:hypothetical protein